MAAQACEYIKIYRAVYIKCVNCSMCESEILNREQYASDLQRQVSPHDLCLYVSVGDQLAQGQWS